MEKKKFIEEEVLYIIEVMFDYYVSKYIEYGKNFIEQKEENERYSILKNNEFNNLKPKVFTEIIELFQNLKNDFTNEISIPSTSVFHFFTLLNEYIPQSINETNNLYTANNVYFDRNTPNVLILKKEKSSDKNNGEDTKVYLKDFFDNYKKKPLQNYIGVLHTIEILIRSVFFFSFYKHLEPKEKELLLNYFVWMVISSYKNLFKKNGFWKMGYYFRKLLEYLFFEGDKIIASYDDNRTTGTNLKEYIKLTYKATSDKIALLLENDLITAVPNIILPNRIDLMKKKLKEGEKRFIVAPPFFMTVGKDLDKKTKVFNLYIAITTINLRLKFCNVILSYTKK